MDFCLKGYFQPFLQNLHDLRGYRLQKYIAEILDNNIFLFRQNVVNGTRQRFLPVVLKSFY